MNEVVIIYRKIYFVINNKNWNKSLLNFTVVTMISSVISSIETQYLFNAYFVVKNSILHSNLKLSEYLINFHVEIWKKNLS